MDSMQTKRRDKIFIVAGGTGGHIFPAQAVAHQLLELNLQPIFVTDCRGMRLLDSRGGVPCYSVSAAPFPRRNWIKLTIGVAKLIFGLNQARVLIHRLAPAAAIGFGGYASLPTILMAAHMKLPTMIHEANTVIGRANRFLAPRVSAIATSYRDTVGLAPLYHSKVVQTGVPVRGDILKVRRLNGEVLTTESEIRLLVMGGSQGSTTMSEVVPRSLLQLPIEFRSRLSVVQQCRISDQETVKSVFANASIKATVVPFITNLAEVLGDIHLVICRAGASTVAELAVAGRPALLIPYPYATDDHQMANARAFETAGAGWVIAENDFNIKKLTATLCRIFGDLNRLIAAGAKARAVSTPDAARRVAQLATLLASESQSQ